MCWPRTGHTTEGPLPLPGPRQKVSLYSSAGGKLAVLGTMSQMSVLTSGFPKSD